MGKIKKRSEQLRRNMEYIVKHSEVFKGFKNLEEFEEFVDKAMKVKYLNGDNPITFIK